MTTPDTQALTQEATAIATAVDGLAISDAAGFADAAEMLKTVSAYIKRVGEVFDPMVEASHRAHQVALQQRAGLLKPAEAAKRLIGSRMAAYEQEVERQHREAEAARQREQELLERAARVAAEVEQKRLQAEEDQRALDAAVAAEASGDTVLAERLIAEPVVVDTPRPAPVFVAPLPPAVFAPKAEGVSFRSDWDFEITDAVLIPREYLMPDEVKIRRVVKAMRGAVTIPGVKAIEKRVTTVRGFTSGR